MSFISPFHRHNLTHQYASLNISKPNMSKFRDGIQKYIKTNIKTFLDRVQRNAPEKKTLHLIQNTNDWLKKDFSCNNFAKSKLIFEGLALAHEWKNTNLEIQSIITPIITQIINPYSQSVTEENRSDEKIVSDLIYELCDHIYKDLNTGLEIGAISTIRETKGIVKHLLEDERNISVKFLSGERFSPGTESTNPFDKDTDFTPDIYTEVGIESPRENPQFSSNLYDVLFSGNFLPADHRVVNCRLENCPETLNLIIADHPRKREFLEYCSKA